ncbi:AraC family transcriptional regulator [Leucothrix arctica]|nr:AraC family transcriptional regulator [Leucothrix arctica]
MNAQVIDIEEDTAPFCAPIGKGLSYNSSEKEIKALLSGHVSFDCIQEGLRVHFGEFTELEARTIEGKMQPGLSFNLVFEGQAIFSLADKYYQIGSDSADVEYSLFAVSKVENFKRLLRPGMKIKKLNIFVEKKWFETRSQTDKQKQQIDTLFSQHAVVHACKAPKQMLDIASNLMQVSAQSSLGGQMLTEAYVLQILSMLIEQNSLKVLSDSSLGQQVSQLIWEESKGSTLTLQEIADHIGVSISTLQRRFKQQVGTTVIEFCRSERLEKARYALVSDHLTIGEVAYLSGYQHVSNFISAFTKQYDISPGQYVKEQG